MAFHFYQFDGLAIPTEAAEYPLGEGQARSSLVRLADGTLWDARGNERAPLEGGALAVRGVLTAATSAALRDAFDAWQAKKGKVGTLTIRDDATQTVRSTTARLLSATSSRKPANWRHLEVDLRFEALRYPWAGTAHTDATNLSAAETGITVVNNGNVRQTRIAVRVTAQTSNITNLIVRWDGPSGAVCRWSFQGTIVAGQTLIVDCGGRAVTNNGVDAFASFVRAAEHNVSEWLRLEPGNNSVTVTRTGGGATSSVRFDFSDAWG